jgi:hypothetical protein
VWQRRFADPAFGQLARMGTAIAASFGSRSGPFQPPKLVRSIPGRGISREMTGIEN